ncbi:MAG TPA: hypothetical protein VFT22_37820 [Kofleriaceae bacterium]|nr:hypothetical protein [Kofleriaceae bacterium]
MALCAAAALAGAGRAHAQSSTASAAATAEFDRGRALLKAGKYPEACAAFEHSQKLEPASGTLYNLAGCHAKLGKLASAWVAYRELAQRDANPARRADSARQAKLLEPRLPRLLIRSTAAPPGLVVTMNGQDVTALLGVDSPVDLGTYQLIAKAPGFQDRELAVEVTDEGKTVTATLELEQRVVHEPPPPPPPVAAPAIAPGKRAGAPDEPPPEAGTASHRRAYGAIAGGAGVALVATGLVFGNLARGKWNDVKKLCGNDLTCDPGQAAEGNRLSDSAHLDGNIATGLVIGGAVALGAGAYLWFTAPSRADRTALRVLPGAGTANVGLTLAGGF